MAAVFQCLRAGADVVGLGLHRCALRFRCCLHHHLGISLYRWATATRMQSGEFDVTLQLALGKCEFGRLVTTKKAGKGWEVDLAD